MYQIKNRDLAKNVVVRTSRDVTTLEHPSIGYLLEMICVHFNTTSIYKYLVNYGRKQLVIEDFFLVDLRFILLDVVETTENIMFKRLVKKMLTAIETDTWLNKVSSPYKYEDRFRELRVFKKTPLPHQITYINRYLETVKKYKLNGHVLTSPAGSGKTLTSLFLAEILDADRVIILTPKAAIDEVWTDTLNTEFRNGPVSYYASNTRSKLDKQKYIVIHYHSLVLHTDLLKRLRARNPMVIIDESHNFNEYTTTWTKDLVNLVKEINAKNVLWVSGTSLKALSSELVPMFLTTDPRFKESHIKRFTDLYGKSSNKRTDFLSKRVQYMSFDIDKREIVTSEPIETDVLIDLPNGNKYTLFNVKMLMEKYVLDRLEYYSANKKKYRDIFNNSISKYREALTNERDLEELDAYLTRISIIARSRNIYDVLDEVALASSFEKEKIEPFLDSATRKKFRDAKSVIKYVDLKVRGEALGRIVGALRAECINELALALNLKQFIDESEAKTLIFTSYVNVINTLAHRTRELKLVPAIVTGETTSDLPAIINRYGRDPKYNPMLATFKSLATAVPVTDANTCILMNQPFRYYEKVQSMSRVDRLGQKRQVYIYNVLLNTEDEPNISTRSLDILEWSKQEVDKLMGKDKVIEDEVMNSALGDDLYIHILKQFKAGLKKITSRWQ